MAYLKIRTVVFTSTVVPAEVLFIMMNVPPELNSNNQRLVLTHVTFPANPSAMSKSLLILMSVVFLFVLVFVFVSVFGIGFVFVFVFFSSSSSSSLSSSSSSYPLFKHDKV